MSFRLRVLALVALVAIVATGLTAWLTLQQASRQITQSADARQEAVEEVADALTEYGRAHGTWEGVAALVDELGYRTGQRIQVRTEYGEVLVDTDTLAGRTARPVDSPPIPVDPRPALELPVDEAGAAVLGEITVDAIDRYRSSVLFAACLTRSGHDVAVADGPYGVPRSVPDPGVGPAGDQSGRASWCADGSGGGEVERDVAAVQECVEDHGDRRQLDFCLASTFAQRTDSFAPVPVHVYLGAVDEESEPLSPVPVLAAAAMVAALAVAGSVLLSRRMLRPVRALTAASRRLGAGDLRERVPVVGRDELAGLARSFNRMADSLQHGEERQRRLIADVAHELRTPLANVRGYLEALRDGVVTPDPELFASLYEEAVLQQRVVDDLQELALAEAGSLIYHRSRVDLGELLETSCASHQAVADAAGVELSVVTGAQAVAQVDPDRLRQAFGNLISNALRATSPGGRVELAAARADSWVVVTVTDTGTGIAPEHLPYVFDRFWRADAARGRRTGGSGLGLAIARQIVTDHGGTIEVASEVEAGTRFTIRLPAAS